MSDKDVSLYNNNNNTSTKNKSRVAQIVILTVRIIN